MPILRIMGITGGHGLEMLKRKLVGTVLAMKELGLTSEDEVDVDFVLTALPTGFKCVVEGLFTAPAPPKPRRTWSMRQALAQNLAVVLAEYGQEHGLAFKEVLVPVYDNEASGYARPAK